MENPTASYRHSLDCPLAATSHSCRGDYDNFCGRCRVGAARIVDDCVAHDARISTVPLSSFSTHSSQELRGKHSLPSLSPFLSVSLSLSRPQPLESGFRCSLVGQTRRPCRPPYSQVWWHGLHRDIVPLSCHYTNVGCVL